VSAAASFPIRDFAGADIDALLDLFRDSVRNVARRDYSEEQVLDWAPDDLDRQAWASKCASQRTFVAALDGTLVGFGDLEADGHLAMMFVRSRFQRRGIASMLLEQIEASARRLHIARLYTEASVTAKPFFEQRGFRTMAPQVVSKRGQEFINYRMEKILDAPRFSP
jgi:putative acetyltransferase